MTFGIIDVGTNSVHLLIGILGLNGTFHVLLKERDLTRLGEGGMVRGRLTAAAMRRTEEVLREYGATLRRFNVDHLEAVATSAVRNARNGRLFVRRIRKRLRLPLRIISGRDEARLIHLGVVRAHRLRRPTAVISIGGGSTQVTVGDGARLRYAVSLPLGCSRMSERFIAHDPARPKEYAALDRYARASLEMVARGMRVHVWRQAVGSSAMVQQLMDAAYLLTHRRLMTDKARHTLTRRSLTRLVRWLAGSTAAERMQLSGLDPRRQDLALATGIVLLAWMELCGVERVAHAAGSLREGLVLDYLIRHHQALAGKIFDPAENADWLYGAEPAWTGRRQMARAVTIPAPNGRAHGS